MLHVETKSVLAILQIFLYSGVYRDINRVDHFLRLNDKFENSVTDH